MLCLLSKSLCQKASLVQHYSATQSPAVEHGCGHILMTSTALTALLLNLTAGYMGNLL